MSSEPPNAPPSPTRNAPAPSRWNSPEAQIRETAYYIWEKEGRPSGRELDHWLKAEREVRTLRDAGSIRDQTS